MKDFIWQQELTIIMPCKYYVLGNKFYVKSKIQQNDVGNERPSLKKKQQLNATAFYLLIIYSYNL